MLVTTSISVDELKKMSEKMFEGLVKAVVDIEKEVIVVDAALHADEEFFLLEKGSNQEFLWGINLFPDKYGTDEFLIFSRIF